MMYLRKTMRLDNKPTLYINCKLLYLLNNLIFYFTEINISYTIRYIFDVFIACTYFYYLFLRWV